MGQRPQQCKGDPRYWEGVVKKSSRRLITRQGGVMSVQAGMNSQLGADDTNLTGHGRGSRRMPRPSASDQRLAQMALPSFPSRATAAARSSISSCPPAASNCGSAAGLACKPSAMQRSQQCGFPKIARAVCQLLVNLSPESGGEEGTFLPVLRFPRGGRTSPLRARGPKMGQTHLLSTPLLQAHPHHKALQLIPQVGGTRVCACFGLCTGRSQAKGWP